MTDFDQSTESRVAIGVLQNDMKTVKDTQVKQGELLAKIDSKIDGLDGKFVLKSEFSLVKTLVFGFVGLVLIAFMAVLTALVFENKQQIDTNKTTQSATDQAQNAGEGEKQTGTPATVQTPTKPQSLATPQQTQVQYQQPDSQGSSQSNSGGGIVDSIRGLFR